MEQARPSKLQPALLGGAVVGVLSALPIIGWGNLCCCLWIVSGGGMAAYLLQEQDAGPITVGDGAAVGALSGLVGAIVWALVSIPLTLATGPMQQRMLERIVERVQDVPPQVRDMLDNLRHSSGFAAAQIGLGLVTMLTLGVIFATMGGILGALFFRRDRPTSSLPPPA